MNSATNDVGLTPLIPADWEIPAHFRRRLGDRVGRQRAMSADGHLLLVLHAPPQDENPDRIGRLFWRNPAGQWQASYTSGGIKSGLKTLEDHFGEYHQRLEVLDEREHRATTADEYFHILNELAPLVRTVRNQHLAWQQARLDIGDARDVINFRDLAYELERQSDLLHSDARNTLDFTIAKRSEQQARTAEHMALAAHRLNVLAAFFFPIVTLSGIMGANLQHGFENSPPPWALLAMLATGLFCGIVLKAIITREPR